MLNRILFLLSLLLITESGFSIVCKSKGNADWDVSSNWTCGHIPVAGDTVVILSGHTVEVTSTFTISGASVLIQVLGTLDFQSGKKMTLPTNSKIELSGWITGGGGGGSSNVITIGSEEVWKSGDGNKSGPILLAETCPQNMNCPLPLTLISFDVKAIKDKSIEISWSTTDEYNIDKILIQRSSDAISWEEITTINSKNTKHLTTYKYTDTDPLFGTSYYRLKEISKNGDIIHYEIKSAFINKENISLDISPNPVSASHSFVINSNTKTEISIYNLIGTVIHEQSLDAGKNIISIFIPSGAYLIKAKTTDGEKTFHLLVQ